jgi:8-oxo-dGTP pyrophosphatase MutT (NUDIX family)
MSSYADRPPTTQTSGAATADLFVTATPPEATPAATVILLRDTDEGLKVLMLQRSKGGAFGGFWVFPGGKVDATDADELETAVREAKEESGLELDPAGFVRFSHWTPPKAEMRRFATWFFLARAPHANDQSVEVDQGEIVRHEWLTPAETLARRDRGEIELAPPTFVSLFVLAQSPTVDHALNIAAQRVPEYYDVNILKGQGRAFCVYAGDVAYDDAELLFTEGPLHRLEITANPWTYERTMPWTMA